VSELSSNKEQTFVLLGAKAPRSECFIMGAKVLPNFRSLKLSLQKSQWERKVRESKGLHYGFIHQAHDPDNDAMLFPF